MLSQLLFVRLKAAEKALRGGRLDDAYRLATALDLRNHRRSRAVLAALTPLFVERARQHYRADRFEEALADLARTQASGSLQAEIDQLREDIRTVQAEQRRNQVSRYHRLDAAKKRIDRGSLAGGGRILEEASENDREAKKLHRQLQNRVEDAMDMIKQAEKLISRGQLATAAQRLRRAKSLDASNGAIAEIETRLCNLILDNTRAALIDGKLRRAVDELSCLGDLGANLPARKELANMLAVTRQATESLKTGKQAEARAHVMRLKRLLPKAKWIDETIKQLKQLDDVTTVLRAGPLGETLESREVAGAACESPDSFKETLPIPGRAASSDELPERLLLLVDGGGSYLLLRSARNTIGRVVSSKPADVPIFSDLGEQHAHIFRADDDYFVASGRDIEVGGRKTKQTLLRDSDRVVLGRKAKFTFRLPSRKSPTAVLDLSDTTKMPNDVRRIVLFHNHATMGPGPAAHLRCPHASPPLVLFERDGALWIRPKSDGHVDTTAQQLRIGEPMEIQGASLVLERWQDRPVGGTNA